MARKYGTCQHCGGPANGHPLTQCAQYLKIRLETEMDTYKERMAEVKGVLAAAQIPDLRRGILVRNKAIEKLRARIRHLEDVNAKLTKQTKEASHRGFFTRQEKIDLILALKDEHRDMTHDTIAEQIGCSREYVTRCLGEYRPELKQKRSS